SPGYIYTIAGTGTAGHSGDNGPATMAHLDLPTGVAVDPSGNLYIADQYNNRVQEVDATGGSQWGLSMTADDMYTVAGSSSGSEGVSGNGTAMRMALLNGPDAVGLDPSGNLYIADTANNRVLIVPKAGCSPMGTTCPFEPSNSMTADDIYTVAGSSSGTAGHSGDGSAATGALLGEPAGIALDASGDLYIADTDNNRVQEVAAAGGTQWAQSMTEGDIYTVAGSMNGTEGTSGLGGLASSALLSGVTGVATDAVGDLFVADTYNYQVDEVPTVTATVGASYTYNGDGLEASRTSSGMLTQFTWGELAGSGLPTIISDGANDYVYGPTGEPVEQVSLATSAPTYLTYTPSDSSWLSTNEAGDETGFWRYDAFGTLAFGTPTSPFGYSGQYSDASTGFVNDRARWYQAQTGEFTTRDPAFASTDTAYAYAGDDPVNESDPSGEVPLPPISCWENSNCNVNANLSQLDGRQEYAFLSFLLLDNWTPIMAAAVVGNLTYESGDYLDPSELEGGCIAPSPVCGIGIAQWSATNRRQALAAAGGWVAGVPYDSLSKGYGWNSTLQSMFTHQVGFAISEFLGSFYFVTAEMENSAPNAPQTSGEATAQLQQAVYFVRRDYEVGDPNPARYIDAARVFNRFARLAGVSPSIQADENADGSSDAASGSGAPFPGPRPFDGSSRC
ncbi:MAG TPA: phage tail tip lysozyme, partial [Acidimicrobiales bacterium]|nr:phage tail tip lysozyme [Acidimicrobiales bacterium]